MVRGAGKGRLQGVARELGLVWLFVLFQNVIFLLTIQIRLVVQLVTTARSVVISHHTTVCCA